VFVTVSLGALQVISMGAVPPAGTELAGIPAGYTLQYYDDSGVFGRQPPFTFGADHYDVVYDGLIDPKQCGQFIEPLCNLIPSMTAQQVENTSFEDEPPYRADLKYKEEIDKPHRPWYPDGAVHMAAYSFDAENPFNGLRSQKIEIKAAHCRAGISQDGFVVREGVRYRLRLQMRAAGNVSVWVSLHGGGRMLAGPEKLESPGETWQPAEAMLQAAHACDNATLTIEFEGPGVLWLDRVYLIGEDATLGIWRADVVDALKAMNPGVVRFGGAAMVDDYEWEHCVGPWDRRAPYTTYWGSLEPNFVGPEEFIQLCRYVNAEPLLCIRWHGKTPEDAAAQVEYLNGAADSNWGRRRAENGHPEPYNVRYWQIGNEVGGAEYDNSLKAFVEAMRRADPSIKILTSYPSQDTLAKVSGTVDYLCPHHYGCEDLIGKEDEFKRLREWIGQREEYRNVRVAVTEWNTTAGDFGLARGALQTLSNALSCARYHNLMQRYADLVEIAIRSNLINSFASGVIQTGPGWLFTAPTYHAEQLYARAAGNQPLLLKSTPNIPWHTADVDISATIDSNSTKLRVYAVNVTGEVKTVRFQLDLPGFSVKDGHAFVLCDREGSLSPEVMNSRDDPDRVAIREEPATVSGNDFEWEFAPLSLTLLELEENDVMDVTAQSTELAGVPAGYTLQCFDNSSVFGRQPPFTVCVDHYDVVHEGLKEGVPYVLAVTYPRQPGYPWAQSVTAGSVVIHGPLELPDEGAHRYIFAVPPKAVSQGKLTLSFHRETGWSPVPSAIELWAPLPARDELRFTLMPDMAGMLGGKVENITYTPIGGALISIKNVDTGTCIDTQTGSDGMFSVDVSAQVEEAKNGSFLVSARHAGMEATATARFDDLRDDEPVIRPIPSRLAGIEQGQVLLDGVWKIWQIEQGGQAGRVKNARDFVVPGQWLQQGFGFSRDSAVGLERKFEVPADWAGKRIFLKFDAVHGGADYWLNGHKLGYSENLFTPIEFDVTDAVHIGGKNTLIMAVTVDTASELASFSSEYAFHNLGGIDRSARIYALPTVHLTDLSWTTDFDAQYRDAVLSLNMNIENTLQTLTPGLVCNVKVRELHSRKLVASQEQTLGDLPTGTSAHEMKLDVREPRQWSDENPNLYGVSVEIRKGGRLLERIERRVGFRTVAVREGRLLVNGRSVKLAGVNRHEIDPLTGRAATARHAKEDARLFKDANFNYIRTSHYPPTSEFLDACDELGLYVECEAPFCWARDGHGQDDPSLGKRFLTPTAAMVRAHRNHPSIILWSIANESGSRPHDKYELPVNFELMFKYFRWNDPSRLVVFNNEWARDGGGCDLAVLHYPSWPPEDSVWLKEDTRPVLLDEYFPPLTWTLETLKRNPGLDVVNWSGGQNRAQSFWSDICKSPRVVGGAIWAGIDESFLLPDGRTVGYGPWGFIDVWRRPKSLWWDAKLIFSPVHITVRQVEWAPGQKSVEIPIENRYSFTDLNQLKVAWEVSGKRGVCRMDLAPGHEGRLVVKLPRSTREGDLLELRFYDRSSNIVTAHGVRLGREDVPVVPTPSAGCPQWNDDGKTISVVGNGVSFSLDKSSLEITGNTALLAFPRLFLTRFEEVNPFNPNGATYAELPDQATRTIREISVMPSADYLSIVVADAYTGYEGTVELRIDNAGQCQVSFDYGYTGEECNVGELGMQFFLSGQCDAIDWKRKPEWDVLPEDHIGRASGSALARVGNKIDPVTGRPDGPWHLDANEFGTRDFRGTKYYIYDASVRAHDGQGLRVNSDGSVDVRACLAGKDVAVYMLQSEERGEKTLPWPWRPAPRQMKSGARIVGEFSVCLLHE
jgi:alpha-L-arabinofuranosidase